MMLCCTAKSVNSPTSIRILTTIGPLGGPSRVVGTAKFPMKPMAYRKVAKKIR